MSKQASDAIRAASLRGRTTLGTGSPSGRQPTGREMAGLPPLPKEPKEKDGLTPEFRRKVELARATGALDPEHVASIITPSASDDLSLFCALDDLFCGAGTNLFKDGSAFTDQPTSRLREAAGKT